MWDGHGHAKKKSVDVGGFCCPPAVTDRLPGLRFHTLGISPIAILVHKESPIDNLTSAEVRNIFQGRLTHWDEVRGDPKSRAWNLLVQPVSRLHCKFRPGHWRLILDSKDDFSPDIVNVPTAPDMITQVARYPGAIGYEEIWNISRYKQKGSVKFIKIDGNSPLDSEAILSGKYPFYRVHNLTTWSGEGVSHPAVIDLIRFLLGRADRIDPDSVLIPPGLLRRSGWRFRDDELVGEPY